MVLAVSMMMMMISPMRIV
ncbi:hypothetical protein CICLE_v100299852mg, partial [Citrus x clementina]